MRFSLKKPRENIFNLARIMGYQLVRTTPEGEFSLIRPLARDYPRFHLYLTVVRLSSAYLKDQGDVLDLNLHLDQKRPSYGRETAHSGEYDGSLVEAERQRIEQVITSLA